MTTLKQYVEWVNHFYNNNPEYADLPVFYSTDDEGNSFDSIKFEPSAMVFYDVNQRYPKPYHGDDSKEPNAIIIN